MGLGKRRLKKRFFTCACFVMMVFCINSEAFLSHAQASSVSQADTNNEGNLVFKHPLPILKDPRLKVEVVADGLTVPTGILFLDKHKMLVLQRYESSFPLGGITTVKLLTDGQLRDDPVLKVLSGLCDINYQKPKCGMFNERGLLGITARKINPNNVSLAGNLEVFLYFTEITLTGEILGNRVYKYLWDGEHLINPDLILSLPAGPGPNHNAGKILIGPDGYLYTVIGDKTVATKVFPIHEDPLLINKIIHNETGHRGQVQNIKHGSPPDNTSGIFRVNPENGQPAYSNPFVKAVYDNKSGINTNNEFNSGLNDTNGHRESTLDRYYAYGIRNSFGLAFDPISGKLWNTENGEFEYDEINLVEPGFNSGWAKIMGPIDRYNATKVDIRNYGLEKWKELDLQNSSKVTPDDLVSFVGSNYSDPEFSWKNAIGVTALGFLNSSKLGEKYKNNLFVGDYIYGNLYYFKINENRTGIEFSGSQKAISDKVSDNSKEVSQITIGTGFDIITDIKTGPDGYLYIVSYTEYSNLHPANVSRIYRIVPATD